MQRVRQFGTWVLDRGVILGAALVATAAALIASYSGLSGVAGLAGWTERVRPMLPLTVDVIAVAAGVLVQRTRDTELRRHAWRGVTWATIVSVLGNAVDHLWVITHSGDTQSLGAWVRVVLAVLISACPAVGIAYVVHLLALMTGTAEAAPAPVPAPVPDDRLTLPEDDDDAPAAELFTLPRTRHAASARPGTKKERGFALLDAAAEAGTPLTTHGLADALGVGLRYAQILVADWEKSA